MKHQSINHISLILAVNIFDEKSLSIKNVESSYFPAFFYSIPFGLAISCY